MIRSKRKPISGDSSPPPPTMMALPNELLIEIMTWLPGKQIGRCKCVSKLWRDIIRSRPFSEAYRKRQRGLLLFWSKTIKDRYEHRYAYRMVRLHFFHCPLRRSEEPLGEFSFLRQLEFGADGETLSLWGMTQIVNGLLCVREMDGWGSDLRLTLHNICTGEKMSIPDCLPRVDTYSTYHLGYDPTRRMYKLLRLIFRVRDESFQGAHIMNLRPPSDSQPTWRELDYNVAGLRSLHFLRGDHLSEETTSPEDGMLCWIGHQRLICFDLNRESFWFVEHPVAGPGLEMVRFSSLTRAITRFMDRLVIWFSSSADDFHVISCYVQEDGEGKNWSTKCIEFSKEFKESEGFVVEPGNNPYFSRGEMLVRNSDQSWRVYSFSGRHAQHTDKEDVLFLGKLPNRAPIPACINLSQCWNYFEPVTFVMCFLSPRVKIFISPWMMFSVVLLLCDGLAAWPVCFPNPSVHPSRHSAVILLQESKVFKVSICKGKKQAQLRLITLFQQVEA